jgi:hypothetical protein
MTATPSSEIEKHLKEIMYLHQQLNSCSRYGINSSNKPTAIWRINHPRKRELEKENK